MRGQHAQPRQRAVSWADDRTQEFDPRA